jgi:hypothetical protein
VTEIGPYTVAGINNSGQVAVQYTSAQEQQLVGIWFNGSVTPIGLTGSVAPDFKAHEAKGISNNGQVIINLQTYLTSWVWDNGSFTEIQPLPFTGGTSYGTEAFGINDAGLRQPDRAARTPSSTRLLARELGKTCR